MFSVLDVWEVGSHFDSDLRKNNTQVVIGAILHFSQCQN